MRRKRVERRLITDPVLEPSLSPLDGIADVVHLKAPLRDVSGCTSSDWSTREATEDGSSQDRGGMVYPDFLGITLPSSSLNPSRDDMDAAREVNTFLRISYNNILRCFSKYRKIFKYRVICK